MIWILFFSLPNLIGQDFDFDFSFYVLITFLV